MFAGSRSDEEQFGPVLPVSKYSDNDEVIRIKFVDGMSVKLHCNRDSLDAWWNALSNRNADPMRLSGRTVCEVLK